MNNSTLRRSALALAALSLFAQSAIATAADIELIGVGKIPGTALDGLDASPAILEDNTPQNIAGGFGSALTYTGIDNLYLATPDRGPASGATSYLDRYYLLKIEVQPGFPAPVKAEIVDGRLLTKENGQNFTGLASAFDTTNSPQSLRLDPEGVRVGVKGTFFVSDEYGPFLYEFDASGRRLRALNVPAKFLTDHPSANSDDELQLATKGRQPNRGMEGLAISPDGTKLYGIMQNALIQDGALNSSFSRRGFNNRILEIDVNTEATRELLYQLESRSNGVNEILAINDHEFLVVERDGNGGLDAVVKQIFKIDIANATDVTNVTLPQAAAPLPAGVTPVQKSPFIDLLDPAFGLAGANFPEKIEGLAFGPDLSDRRHLLLVSSDNDFLLDQPSQLMAFAIAPAKLSLQRQVFKPAIDVKPGDDLNTINMNANGVLPVAILSSGLFDATAVDPATIVFAGAAPASKGKGVPQCSAEDVNRDGLEDLLCHFDIAQLHLNAGSTSASLQALTFSKHPVTGADSIRVLPR